MMTNQQFLTAIQHSFNEFVKCGTSRSTAKLKPLHGAIATDLAERLGDDYEIWSQGYGHDKEALINGRYIDKKVDITVMKNGTAIAGLAVKFVMQNYSQNSNNYFENMLGETANIRSNKVPYFQIFIILDRLPYYNKDKFITKWETLTEHNIEKYIMLGKDDVQTFFHTPNKTLIEVVHVPGNDSIISQQEYMLYYRTKKFRLQESKSNYGNFGPAVILNNYTQFINKVYHTILSQ